jgi:hypothetical protein
MHVCLKTFACMCVLLKRVWDCTLCLLPKLNVIFAQAKAQGTSEFLWHHVNRSKLVDRLGCNFLVTSITLSLVVSN